MINNTKIEICIGNIDDGLTAAKYPIDRLELNSSLELGGISPSLSTLTGLKNQIDVPICCMVRPRGGDFIYTDLEFDTMLMDAECFLENGADGIVFGFIKDGKIDTERTAKMVELIHSYDGEAVFHKAFDTLADQKEGLKQLIELGIDRVLTSGKAVYPDILEGCKRLNDLQNKYGDKIEILPGGGVRIENIVDVVKTVGSHQVHMTSKRTNPGGYIELDEDQLKQLLNKLETM